MKKKQISAYIDVKTLYGKSLAQDIETGSNQENVKKLLLFQNFIIAILSELLKELENNLENKNILSKHFNKAKFTSVSEAFKKYREYISEPAFIDVSLKLYSSNTNKTASSNSNKNTNSDEIKLSASPKSISGEIKSSASNETAKIENEEEIKAFSAILLRHFSVKDYMEKISSQLKELGMIKVHIFLDDFSEIDYDAQQIFVNTILAPLNNWSDKFFRFKVGAYPKEFFMAKLRKAK